MNDRGPILGITMGDPASIGPEIAVKAFVNRKIFDACRPLVVGDARVIEDAVRLCDLGLKVNAIKSVGQAKFTFGQINVYDLENANPAHLKKGELSAVAGHAAFQTVVETIGLAMKGDIDGTVTGPINKESIHLAGHPFSGHTEIYAHYTGTEKYAMMLVEGDLRVIHVSTHVSLRQACDLVKKNRILDTIELMHQACVNLGIADPRIAVAGLNPHAGEGGIFGWEEKEEIIPAVEEAVSRGYKVFGPIPGDTLFPKAIGGLYDGCVAMYHDQGHIPFKTIGFTWDNKAQKMNSVKGVNITLGLPIIRTSVDHGTAMEIAGKGIASADAMILAIEYAVKLFENRFQSHSDL